LIRNQGLCPWGSIGNFGKDKDLDEINIESLVFQNS
jgi:hypothetical protein